MYFEGEKGWSMVKRFQVETSTLDESFGFLSDHPDTKLYFASILNKPHITYSFRSGKVTHEKEIDIEKFIDVKGWKALGNKIGEFKITKVHVKESEAKGKAAATAKLKEEDENIEDELKVQESVKEKKVPQEPKAKAKKATPKVRKKTEGKASPKKPDDDKEDDEDNYNVGDTIEFDF